MEENLDQKKYFAAEGYVEQLRKERLQLRYLIKKIMEEEVVQEYAIEDNLSEILKSFTKEQQESVYRKLHLAQTFPDK
jgi:hypothetical protein